MKSQFRYYNYSSERDTSMYTSPDKCPKSFASSFDVRSNYVGVLAVMLRTEADLDVPTYIISYM